jgi:L-threonylcarbamoyladenylate synthase
VNANDDGLAPGSVITDPELATRILASGGVVALPTETVYGLGADATNLDAIARIFDIKGRPRDHPLILHVADPVDLEDVAQNVTPPVRRLVEAFWPGPLSVIVPAADGVSRHATGGRDTVAVRCPDHDLTRRVLRRLGRSVAAPSANRFGRVSPTTAAHVVEDLGTSVDAILDGGVCRVGLESTIVDCTVDPPQLLRPGGLSAEGPSRAPGMLASHYAPRCRIIVVDEAIGAMDVVLDERSQGHHVELLDPAVTPEMWAHHLYQWLRDADRRRVDVLVVVPPEDRGLGSTVRDRLSRASAGR